MYLYMTMSTRMHMWRETERTEFERREDMNEVTELPRGQSERENVTKSQMLEPSV